MLAKINDVELYQNTFATTLRELTELDAVQQHDKLNMPQTKDQFSKSMILHPTKILFKQGQFIQNPGYPLKVWTGIDISTCEVELSVK